MASLTSTVRTTFDTVSSSIELIGSLANTGVNHVKIWEAESEAKLEQRLADVKLKAKADSITYKQQLALQLMTDRKEIAGKLKTQSDVDLFNKAMEELTSK